MLELLVVTAGVLIALMVDSLVEWNHFRVLVREARQNIAREIRTNRDEARGIVQGKERYDKQLESALQFADELIAKRTTQVRSLEISFHLADVNFSAWRTAEQTGALAHMDYGEVERYARVYGLQQLFDDMQRRTVEAVALSLSGLGSGTDPTQASPDDLKVFRQRVLELRALAFLQQQLAERLVRRYEETLGE